MSSSPKLIQTKRELLVMSLKIRIGNALATGERDVNKIAKMFDCSINTVYHYRKKYLEDRCLDEDYFMSRKEVAEELNTTVDAVRGTEARAMKKMREYIDANDGLEDVLREIFRLAELKDTSGTNWNVE